MTRRRAVALAAVWTLPSAALLLYVWIQYGRWRIEVPPPLSPEARAAVVTSLRDAVSGRGALAPEHPALQRRLPAGGPVVASLWLDGMVVARAEGYGGTIAEATHAAATLVAAHPVMKMYDTPTRARALWKVDIVVGRGPIERNNPIVKLVALHPGVDGLGVTVERPGDDPSLLLLPDEMFLESLLAKKPITNLVPDVGMGIEFDKAEIVFARRAKLTVPEWKAERRRYFRFRTEAFLEVADGAAPPLPLVRGLPLGPPVTPVTLEAAALAGARYLVEHLAPNGRYIYEQNLITGRGTNPAGGAYSLPRHAGTTYFLAEVYRHTKAEWLREPVERAAGHLDDLVEAGGCAFDLPDGTHAACVIDRGEKTANLGSTALGVVALAEYQRATGDKRFLPLATALTEWIVWMQRDDGSFRHLYSVPKRERDDKTMMLYFSGEAALALARMYEVTGDVRYAKAAERGLDWLVGWYDFFMGGFLYGEEHWTCIASEALAPYVKKDAYLDFCNGLARFWGQSQARPGDYPDQPDLVGSHNLTPFVMPQNTPAGSHSEARISTYLLGRYHGRPDASLRRDILETLEYLLRQQMRLDNAYAVPPAARGIGGIAGNPVDRTVRIDYVQHVCSAFIRAVELAEEEERARSR